MKNVVSKNPWRRATSRSAAIVIASMATVLAAVPAVASEAPEIGGLTLMVENDLFYNRDRDYTSGIALAWGSTAEPPPDLAMRIAHLVP